jgi:hypothetical protein
MSTERGKRIQWHPLFAELLRPLLRDYYEVQTNAPVGDLPREADILLLRRTSADSTPFRGLWRHLTTWNILEYKCPTVDARLRDLSLLVEVGLGIHRRLNTERRRQKQKTLNPDQTAFWYIARALGRRVLLSIRRGLGRLDEIEAGLWHGQLLEHSIFLVSSETFASEPDSVPLHLLIQRPSIQESELAHLIVEQPGFLDWYAPVFSTLHSEAWKEISEMATTKKRKGLEFDFSAIKDDLTPKSLANLIENMGEKRILEMIGPKEVIKKMGMDWLLSNLSPAELKELKERLT